MTDEREGLPLGDALRAYGDPQLWGAYKRAQAALDEIPRRPSWLFNSRGAIEAWSERHAAAKRAARAEIGRTWNALIADFKERLQGTELALTGIEMPLTRGSKPENIPAPLRSVLILDFNRSTARRDTLQFIDVRVTTRDLGSTDGGPGGGPSFVGRKSLMRAIEQQMRSHAEQGDLRASLAKECRALEAWARAAFPHEQTPTVKTIENGLRQVYRQLKSREMA